MMGWMGWMGWCWHKWSKWGAVTKSDMWLDHYTQDRHCEKCGMVDRRAL